MRTLSGRANVPSLQRVCSPRARSLQRRSAWTQTSRPRKADWWSWPGIRSPASSEAWASTRKSTSTGARWSNAIAHPRFFAATALVESVARERVSPTGLDTFLIRESERQDAPTVRISPDLPVCGECLREMPDPGCQALRISDSVVRPGVSGPVILRRARGYAPGVVSGLPASRPILAVGADLKYAITLVVGGDALTRQPSPGAFTNRLPRAFPR
jgi:hypothetical protein